ncbi:MAG: aminomethyl-transferring glycine dehydrogenase subunit GcvPB [Alphaproteobacteria bacterium]|nr:aminomethyl-transferring glycine dehydrogenase subunit GcvPB [Alphaproteobacteria bacterium]MBU0795876.1 aminomethyl-transferring glycine dehydrogenase subunit GcvPB [Alphaproteobacteria bacterium]MBU0888588.1 aminomethyl-transferring glycine dehydrogenase subunit GcvPB [Alphaproteobacteria bacterium]MBU1813678.1 aminomethyl-transferring glycine dehydrogenase subunit GcvPB [Alphaproteobacteria bacterium]
MSDWSKAVSAFKSAGEGAPTMTGNLGLQLEEPLIFEQGEDGRCGVDLPPVPKVESKLGGLARKGRIGLPGLSEPQVVRHYTRLSQKNYAIDAGLYPLGSCTMKHNPRLNEKMARLPGFSDVHPLQPVSTVQGALELIDTLAHWLKTLTGMPAVAMSPAAGAHGELCGMMAIRAAIEAKGERRTRVLVPESAHGTNPATAAACGYIVDPIPANARGRVDIEAFKAKLGDDVAAVMITNPNTCGLFESEIIEIAELIHSVGGYFYCDGANFNAIVGRVRPGDLGVDAMHINLHKTFSTPHGGGGPGAGPVVLSEALAKFVPMPYVVQEAGSYKLVEHEGEGGQNFGRLKAFQGQMGMFVRALTYMMSHGADGLRQVASDAVLNANYILARLKDEMSPAFDGPCMHEALFDDTFLKGTGVTTLDFAKAMIDEGYHPMTMYFPLVVHGALLIEPTETESKDAIDQFIAVLGGLAQRAKQGDQADWFRAAPRYTPRRRLDETSAARKPILRWMPETESKEAAD